VAEFYLDHDVKARIAELLHGRGHGARTARDLSLDQAGDDEHLLLAAQNAWILVTTNRKDFELLHNAWRRWTRAWNIGHHHAGILVLHQPMAAEEAAAQLEQIVLPAESLANTLHRWRPTAGWVQRR